MRDFFLDNILMFADEYKPSVHFLYEEQNKPTVLFFTETIPWTIPKEDNTYWEIWWKLDKVASWNASINEKLLFGIASQEQFS